MIDKNDRQVWRSFFDIHEHFEDVRYFGVFFQGFFQIDSPLLRVDDFYNQDEYLCLVSEEIYNQMTSDTVKLFVEDLYISERIREWVGSGMIKVTVSGYYAGSGKTTLLSMLAGLETATAGEVFYRGNDVAKLDRDIYRRDNAAVIYQSYNLFPLLTAEENVLYPLKLKRMNRAESKVLAKEKLRQVGIAESQFKRFPAQLSGGEQQRVAIARALAAKSFWPMSRQADEIWMMRDGILQQEVEL